MDKLTMYASLVGVVTAIGGGFYAWGEFNTRLSAIEGSNVDVSGISKNAEQIAVVNENWTMCAELPSRQNYFSLSATPAR